MGLDQQPKNFFLRDGRAFTEDHIVVRKIFVYKIPKISTKDDVNDYFSKFGELKAVKLLPGWGRNRRKDKIAFVQFSQADGAARVLETVNHYINGARISVNADDSWRQPAADDNIDFSVLVEEVRIEVSCDCLECICKKLNIKQQVRFSSAGPVFNEVFRMCAAVQHKTVDLRDFSDMSLWEIYEFFKRVGHLIEQLKGGIVDKHRYRIMDFIGRYSPQVHTVRLDSTRINVVSLRIMAAGLNNLTHLYLNKCRLNDRCILALQDLPKLKVLHLRQNGDLTGKYMINLKQLTSLSLFGCVNMQPVYISCICKSLKKLRKLDIRGCAAVSSEMFLDMAEHCRKLEMLQISNCNVQYECVAMLPKLKSLIIHNAEDVELPIREELFVSLAAHKAGQLQLLKFGSRDSMTLLVAESISCLKQLKSLHCARNANLNDDCLRKLSELRNLEDIVLKNCFNISNNGLLELVRGCTQLKRVNIQGCRNITNEFVVKVTELLKKREQSPYKTPISFFVIDSAITAVLRQDEYIKLFFNQLYEEARLQFVGDPDSEDDISFSSVQNDLSDTDTNVSDDEDWGDFDEVNAEIHPTDFW